MEFSISHHCLLLVQILNGNVLVYWIFCFVLFCSTLECEFLNPVTFLACLPLSPDPFEQYDVHYMQ